MVQHTFSLTPRVVSSLRAGFFRSIATGGNEAQDQGPILKAIGIGNTNDDRGISYIGVLGHSPFGRSNGDVGNRDNTWHVAEELHYARANHSIKLGAQVRYRRGWHLNANANALGSIFFEPAFTAQLVRNVKGQLTPLENTGNGWADFLLGLPTMGQVSGLPVVQYRSTQFLPFVQDTWKVTRNLTLNYGVSLYLETPPDPQGMVRKATHGFDPVSGLLTYAALGQMSPSAMATDWNNVAPRLGLAWKPRALKATVIRAGTGIYYSELPWISSQFSLVFGSPMGANQSFMNPQTDPTPEYVIGRNIFPPIAATTLDENYAANLPSGSLASAIDPSFRTTYSTQWNLSVQQGLGKDSLELSYLGSSGHRMLNLTDLDQCRPGRDLFCNVATKPWPRYAVLAWIDSSGNASYEALIAKYQHRMDRGLNLRFEYALAKALTDSWQSSLAPDSQITACRACDKGPATFDVRHRAVASVIWQLPFARGRRLAGGWNVSAIITFATGQPVYLTGPNRTGSLFINHLPNRVCDGRSSDISASVRNNGSLWFDTSCFPLAPLGYFGDSGRTVLNGPGVNNWDLGVEKSFRLLWEPARLSLRAEAFNIWNHTQFQQPNGDLSAGENFGRISATRPPRLIQIGMKLLW